MKAEKIVHIIDNLTLGGAETLLFSTIKRLPQYQHHIIILNHKIQISGIESYAQIHCLNHSGWITVFRTCKRLKGLVSLIQPAVIHSHLFLSSFLTRVALGTSYNIVYSIHNLYSATVFAKLHTRMLEKFVYNDKHQLITVSGFVLEDYKKVVTHCKNGYVLYNFIDDVFIKNPAIQKSAPSVNLNKWVAVGSLKSQKNYDLIISLFQALYHFSDDKESMSLDIYGDGAMRKELEQKVKSSGLPIRFKGMVKGLETVLGQYDAYISASIYEGYGIAPMESLAIGLPVFLSNIPVYKEIYKDHAFFFELHKDPQGTFLKACQSYLSLSINEKEYLQAQSKKYATAIAKCDSYIDRLLGIYQLNKKQVVQHADVAGE